MINQSWGRPKVVKGGMTLAKSTDLRDKHKYRDVALGIGVRANEEAGRYPLNIRLCAHRKTSSRSDVGIPGCLGGKKTC